MSAHRRVAYAIQKGELLRQPCESCGNAPAHAHHDDYNRPLDVRWLCPTHHREWHQQNQAVPLKNGNASRDFNAAEAWTHLESIASRYGKGWKKVICDELGLSLSTILRWEQGKVQLGERWFAVLGEIACR